MPWEGSERACVNFNCSEALTWQIRVACLAAFLLGLLQCEGSAGLEWRWVLWPGSEWHVRGRSDSLDHKFDLVCTCLRGLLARGYHQYG